MWPLWLALVMGSVAEEAAEAVDADSPTDQTLVYYNARMALREDRPLEATKLWLLRNAIEDKTGKLSKHDDDFGSVTWAALGELGVCQDGHVTDDDGAGLWPVGLHNWVVKNRGRRARPRRPNPFDAFELDRQQRYISIDDVLGYEELRTVRLYRGFCVRPRIALILAGAKINARFSDREVAARVLRYLLERSRETLSDTHVRGQAAIEARLFDLDLQLTELAARKARQRERERARQGRQIGLSRDSVDAMRDDAPEYAFSDDSRAARILHRSVEWPVSEWMSLSADRRLFVFDHAYRYTQEEEALEATALGIIDALTARGEGEEVVKWVGMLRDSADPRVWRGERGERLMNLDLETGFTERGVIALHRGVDQLQRGLLSEALASFAFAMHHGLESSDSEAVQNLSVRWLTYVSAQFEITDELLVTLQQIVSSREYGVILEDLMWSTAFRADGASYDRGLRNQMGRGALERRLALLEPIARGDSGGFLTSIRDGIDERPSETLRFLDQLVQRLELEEADVRAAHLPMLQQLRQLLLPLVESQDSGSAGRKAGGLRDRTQAIVEGLGGDGQGPRDRARSVDPDAEVYAGSVRLAPADALPWPFSKPPVTAPSVFVQLDLTPVEWRTDDGLVMGWSITE